MLLEGMPKFTDYYPIIVFFIIIYNWILNMLAATTILELEEQIRHRYDTLSKRLQQVAVYILDRHHSAAFDTVAVIADKVQVPPSTLIRFANAFNFSGFNEMKQLFRDRKSVV